MPSKANKLNGYKKSQQLNSTDHNYNAQRVGQTKGVRLF